MLDEQHSSFLHSQLSNNAALEHEMSMIQAVESAEYNLFSMLRPKVYKDGNMWCVLYGENIQDGICGFGETPHKAVLDFNKSWNKT